MANVKGKTEGGSGGRRGHSNQDHWMFSDEVKRYARRQRRADDRSASDEGIDEAHAPDPDNDER